MKDGTGTTIASLGGLLTILGMTILSDFHIIKFIALGLGLILAIIGVYLEQKAKEKKKSQS
ncbi:hypothetical protein [uncultured Aquimarina sp.]|uniref:hypothetical protein n=1 Tax=uncultured Aquimarina sp. TaxID=575652 RepID=UPI00262DFBBA|nr:hypothetical protein [uncultured Aquimarina sp.]